MKNLKDILTESILDDIEDTLSKGTEAIYPVPTVKDFEKLVFGGYSIVWYCKDFIQEYMKILKLGHPDLNVFFETKIKNIDSLRATIYKDKTVSVSLSEGYDGFVSLFGVGDFANEGVAKEKKYIIEFFNKLAKNPKNFKRLFEFSNKNNTELYQIGILDNTNIKDITEKILK